MHPDTGGLGVVEYPLPHQATCAVKAGFDGGLRNFQDFRGVVDAAMLDGAEHEDRSKCVGELIDALFEKASKLQVGYFAFRQKLPRCCH